MARKFLLILLSGAALLGSSGCATLDDTQARWIFRPSREAWRGGEDITQGMHEHWIEFASKVDAGQPVKLHALWLPQARADAPVLLFLHGARWDLRGSATRMRRMHELGFSVLGVDYRGFGRSSGDVPSEPRAYEDARQAWSWLAAQHPGKPRYIFGHSLGGAVAVQLAASVADEAGLIVEGTFTSVADVVATYRWGFAALGILITQRFESINRIAEIGSPLLVVHGTADTVIAPTLGERLYAQARSPKRLEKVEGGTHHNTNAMGMAQYRRALGELFGLSGQVTTTASTR